MSDIPTPRNGRNARRRSHQRISSNIRMDRTMPVVSTARRRFVSTFHRITHPESLVSAFNELRQLGGQAAGVDWLTYDQFSGSEIWDCCRGFSRLLQEDLESYIPQPVRKQLIPKPGTDEFRPLELTVVKDRTLSKSANTALAPRVDAILLPRCYGFRRRIGPTHLFAQMVVDFEESGFTWFAQDDIRKAFESINVNTLLPLWRTLISDPTLVRLIEIILRGEQSDHYLGIRQGDCLSPRSLNLMLHDVFDSWMHIQEPTQLWYRFVDNLAGLCPSDIAGRQLLQGWENRLRAHGLTLKHVKDRLVDLSRHSAEFLGLRLQVQQHELLFSLTHKAEESLRDNLKRCIREADPDQAAKSIVAGWVSAYPGAFQRLSGLKSAQRINLLCVACSFRHLGTRKIRQWIDGSIDKWETTLKKTREERFFCAGLLPQSGSASTVATERSVSSLPPCDPSVAPFDATE